MNLQIDFWQLVGLLLSGLGALIGVMKFGVAQAQKHQDETHKQLIARLDSIEKSNREEAAQWQRLERDFLEWKGDLPLHYVRREDHIRGMSVIESKLDSLGLKLENAQLRGTIGGTNAS